MTMKDRLPLVADLLMEAAHADNRLDGEEKDAVKSLLCGILEVPSLPMDLAFHIDEFDAKGFDRGVATKAFAADPPALKKRLLELVAAQPRPTDAKGLDALLEAVGQPHLDAEHTDDLAAIALLIDTAAPSTGRRQPTS